MVVALGGSVMVAAGGRGANKLPEMAYPREEKTNTMYKVITESHNFESDLFQYL